MGLPTASGCRSTTAVAEAYALRIRLVGQDMEVPMSSKTKVTQSQQSKDRSTERHVTVHVDLAACIKWSLIGLSVLLIALAQPGVATKLIAKLSGFTDPLVALVQETK